MCWQQRMPRYLRLERPDSQLPGGTELSPLQEACMRLGSRSSLPGSRDGRFSYSLSLHGELRQPPVTWANAWELDHGAEQLGVKCQLCL